MAGETGSKHDSTREIVLQGFILHKHRECHSGKCCSPRNQQCTVCAVSIHELYLPKGGQNVLRHACGFLSRERHDIALMDSQVEPRIGIQLAICGYGDFAAGACASLITLPSVGHLPQYASISVPHKMSRRHQVKRART